VLDMALDFMGRVTFVTGPGKHCGKTTFMNRAAQLARRGAVLAGKPGPALLTVGYDGEARDYLAGARKPAVPVDLGDIIVTTERFARTCSPEILEIVPGSTALGRLCIARATRAATVALVGPEGNALVAWTIGHIIEEGFADTVLVDGAFNRMTQVAAIDGARFVYVMRVEKSNLEQAAAQVRRLARLLRLPLPADAASSYQLLDALTAETAARLPPEPRTVVVADLTKIFLSDAELAAFMRERELRVGRTLGFGGFIVACRGIPDEKFLDIVADDSITPLVAFNPYESGVRRVA
jgi:hypothetical protein